MAGIFATLGGNPFNTQVGQKIEQATDASLPAENWALNMEICDIINETDEGPKDAVRAIRKRLQQNMGKNYTVVLYTLTVLETCVKNCGRRFHLLITHKDFILDLVKLIGPKNDPPLAIQDRVLSLIQSWADAFHANQEMQGVVHVYQDLKQKGIEFPMTDLDTMAPIITPQRSSVPSSAQNDQPAQVPEPKHLPARISPTAEFSATPSSNAGLKEEQIAKLRGELEIVQGNMKVFGEMLTEMTPGHEHPEDLQLLQELQKTLVAMQSRIMELIGKVGLEDMTNELLHINDELNNLFLRYERYEKKQHAVQHASEVKTSDDSSLQPVENVVDKPLIDFGESCEATDIVPQLQKLNVTGEGDGSVKLPKVTTDKSTKPSVTEVADEFDMFAQSRNICYESAKGRGSSYADNTNLDHLEEGLGYYAQNKGQPPLKDNEVNSVSYWLEEKPASNDDPKHPVPNSEFEKFLVERATAAEMLPDVAASNRPTVSPVPSQPVPSRRQLEKDDTESALFTL